MMKVFVTGANGFVGAYLCRLFVQEGWALSALVRHPSKAGLLPKEAAVVVGDSTQPGPWQQAVAGHDAIINLAGTTVFKRWNDAYKQLIRDSRILTTKNLVDAIPQETATNITLLNASGAGFYGMTGDEELGEDAPKGSDFLAQLARDWEAEATKAADKGARVVRMRFGVVLGRDGGALAQMTLPFRFFVGGPIGSGKQWFSWIHIEDLGRAALFCLQHPEIQGPVNFTAPGPVRNGDLAQAIGRALHRPSFMPAPGFMISLVMGEFGSVILKGQRVVPRVLLEQGYRFNYPDIDAALTNILWNA